jgi:hypothetical protein
MKHTSMYPGIDRVAGDDNGLWLLGQRTGPCPKGCGGFMYYYWQKENYREVCCVCKYLNDTGIKMDCSGPWERQEGDK